jgi:FtsH-binding integral membrane protein
MEQNFNLNTYDVTEVSRVAFIKKTYTHVALAFLVFIIFEAILLNTEFGVNIGITMANSWMIVLGLFMGGTWIANKWVNEPESVEKQYMGLFLYALLEAFIFLPMFIYLLYSEQFAGNSTEVIGQAGVVSVGLFTGLSAIAIFSGKDFSFLKSILTIGFGIALALIIAGYMFGFDLGLAFCGAMVLLAGGSILFQTSKLVHDYNSTQHVAAALGLFASFMLLFYYILMIFMSRD